MSRCFPFPPPGYTIRVDAALIESIKLHEREKLKTDRRKEKSSDKKHKRKAHKEKSHDGNDRKVRKHGDLKDEKPNKYGAEGKNPRKGAEKEVEQLEKSGLTEEHGQPTCPQSPCYLSDGTQISHKRKRDSSLANEASQYGKIIRIKLPTQNRQVPDLSLGKDEICSTSGRDNFPAHRKVENSLNPIEEELCISNSQVTSKIEESISAHAVEEIKENSFLLNDKMLSSIKSSPKTAYDTLFETWVPPSFQSVQFVDADDEWLFGTKQQYGQASKMIKDIDSVPSCRSSSLWSRGQYLPDADIYALPYTIPF